MKEIYKLYKITSNNRWGKRIYEVSNLGNVKCNGKLFKCTIGKNGYYYLCVIPLHRIVAELFISNPDNKPCVDHINTIKTDNRAENLRWVTYSENNNNLITLQRNITTQIGKKLSEETKQKMSESRKGKIPWNKNTTWKVINGKRVWIEKES